MDRSECKRIIDENLEPLMRQFGVPHWKVTVHVEPNQSDSGGKYAAGQCVRMIDYNQAVIKINPEVCAAGDAGHVLEILRHELYHVVISPFDLYTCAVDEVVGEDHPARKALDRVWRHVIEKTVINLGRMFVGLTGEPRRVEAGADRAVEARGQDVPAGTPGRPA